MSDRAAWSRQLDTTPATFGRSFAQQPPPPPPPLARAQLIGHRCSVASCQPVGQQSLATPYSQNRKFTLHARADCIRGSKSDSLRSPGDTCLASCPHRTPLGGRLRGSNMISLIQANFHLLPQTHTSGSAAAACQPLSSLVQAPRCPGRHNEKLFTLARADIRLPLLLLITIAPGRHMTILVRQPAQAAGQTQPDRQFIGLVSRLTSIINRQPSLVASQPLSFSPVPGSLVRLPAGRPPFSQPVGGPIRPKKQGRRAGAPS